MIINIFIWLCSSNVIPQCRQRWRSFFEDPRFLSSPSPPQGLSIYAENIAFFLVAQPSPSMHRNTKHYDRWVLNFIDLEADSCSWSITTSFNDGKFFGSTCSSTIIEAFIFITTFLIYFHLYLGVTHIFYPLLSSLHFLCLYCIIDLLKKFL